VPSLERVILQMEINDKIVSFKNFKCALRILSPVDESAPKTIGKPNH